MRNKRYVTLKKRKVMSKLLKPIFVAAICMAANACSSFDPSPNDIQGTAQIPAQFHAVWVWYPSFCTSTTQFPYIKLEGGGYSIPKPPHSTEPTTFAAQKVSYDETNGRQMRVFFSSADTPGKNIEVALELSDDGKLMSWRERGVANSVELHRCG